MRFAGKASWRFAEGIEQARLVALFVRDTVGLRVPPGAVIPPRLDGELPDYSNLLDTERPAAASAVWTGWWQAVAAQAIRGYQGPPTGVDRRVWLRRLANEYQIVFDPPEFASLAAQPALADAVRATFDGALRWADAQRRALLLPPQSRHGPVRLQHRACGGGRSHPPARGRPGAVGACAMVLPVEGIWWNRFAPGAVLCSLHAAHDPAIARAVLTDAFEFGLAS